MTAWKYFPRIEQEKAARNYQTNLECAQRKDTEKIVMDDKRNSGRIILEGIDFLFTKGSLWLS